MPSWEQFWGQKCVTIKFEGEEISITGDYCSKIEEKVRRLRCVKTKRFGKG